MILGYLRWGVYSVHVISTFWEIAVSRPISETVLDRDIHVVVTED